MEIARGASRRPAARRLAAALAVLLAAAGCTASGPTKPPEPSGAATAAPATEGVARFLQGRPLTGPTGLRLLVASNPPRLLEVDRGTSRRVAGIPAGQDPFSVSRVGEDAIIAGDPEVFLLRRGSSRATPVADGDRDALLDPGTGRVVARFPEIHGVVGDLVLWGDHERHAGPFTLTDRRTGARHPVARPTPHGRAGFGQPSPDGRLLAVEFVDLSWSRVKGQVSDIWLLDLRTRRWRRLPGMPLITAVKAMSMEWADDGRLVLVGDFDRVGEALATWRPGQDHLAIRRLDLPDHDGSDSFVAWPAAGASSRVAPSG
jgi:hypothetical protein